MMLRSELGGAGGADEPPPGGGGYEGGTEGGGISLIASPSRCGFLSFDSNAANRPRCYFSPRRCSRRSAMTRGDNESAIEAVTAITTGRRMTRIPSSLAIPSTRQKK